MINMDNLKELLLDKLNIEIDNYNQSCYDWSNGYKKAILDILEYIEVIEYIRNNKDKE